MYNKYLFQENWKTLLVILFVLLLTFIDSFFPPYGIPITVLAIFILFWLRKTSIKHLGLFKPKSWLGTIAIGLIVGVLIPLFGIYVLSPIRELLGVAQENPEIYQAIEGNNTMLLLVLIISWTTAGLGEELIFRSFLIGQLSSFIKNEKYKYLLPLLVSSIIFGCMHYEKGLDAIIGTAINGLILGTVYLKTNRNIWAAYFAHAIADTFAFLIIYSGLYKLI